MLLAVRSPIRPLPTPQAGAHKRPVARDWFIQTPFLVPEKVSPQAAGSSRLLEVDMDSITSKVTSDPQPDGLAGDSRNCLSPVSEKQHLTLFGSGPSRMARDLLSYETNRLAWLAISSVTKPKEMIMPINVL